MVGLRDRALISVMTFAFARIGAAVAMRVEDYYPKGKRWWVRLHEKGGKRHEMPAHHVEHPSRLRRLKQDSLKLTIGDPRQTMARETVHDTITRRDLIA